MQLVAALVAAPRCRHSSSRRHSTGRSNLLPLGSQRNSSSSSISHRRLLEHPSSQRSSTTSSSSGSSRRWQPSSASPCLPAGA